MNNNKSKFSSVYVWMIILFLEALSRHVTTGDWFWVIALLVSLISIGLSDILNYFEPDQLGDRFKEIDEELRMLKMREKISSN